MGPLDKFLVRVPQPDDSRHDTPDGDEGSEPSTSGRPAQGNFVLR